ncbi:GDP-D-mannose dehydratase, partial [hydrothermal vent metagenome]
DWGYAADYVRIFHSMLQQNSADDYVIATGVLHSVKDMVNCAFTALNYTITWHGEGPDTTATNAKGKVVVAINPKFFRPLDNRFLCGDSTKAQQTLGFNQITPFADWVQSMVLAEYQKPA